MTILIWNTFINTLEALFLNNKLIEYLRAFSDFLIYQTWFSNRGKIKTGFKFIINADKFEQ